MWWVFTADYRVYTTTVRFVNAFCPLLAFSLKDPKEEAKEAEAKASTKEVKEKPKEKEGKEEKCAKLRV